MDFYQFIPIVFVLLCAMGVLDGIRLVLGESSAEYLLRRKFPSVSGDMQARFFSVRWYVRYWFGAMALVLPIIAEHFSYESYDVTQKAAIPVISTGLMFFAVIFLWLAFATLWHGAVVSQGRLSFIGISPFDSFDADVCDVRVDDRIHGGIGAVGIADVSPAVSLSVGRSFLFTIYAPENRRYSCVLYGLGCAVRQMQQPVAPLVPVHEGTAVVSSAVDAFTEVLAENCACQSEATTGTGEDA